jgi:purine-nucleoside phosphorylase
MSEQMEAITRARDYIKTQTSFEPQIALILGSGLGGLADEVEATAVISYDDIPGYPISTVAGHAGQLVLGTLAGKNVVVMQGRLHYYEGYPMSRIAMPIRVLHALGARTLIVTNACGGLNPAFSPGDVMLITDHINAIGANPLIGPNDESIGPRFPDMTHAYDPELQALALKLAGRLDVPLRQGVYVALAGPNYETKAERRYLRVIGGDAVGMSTVPEVIVANHAGMRVLGFSAVTNIATGEEDQPPDDHETVLATAKIAGERLTGLVREAIQQMPEGTR